MKLEKNDSIPRIAYSIHETANALGIAPISLRRLVKRGLIKPSKGLRVLRFSLDEIKRYLEMTA